MATDIMTVHNLEGNESKNQFGRGEIGSVMHTEFNNGTLLSRCMRNENGREYTIVCGMKASEAYKDDHGVSCIDVRPLSEPSAEAQKARNTIFKDIGEPLFFW